MKFGVVHITDMLGVFSMTMVRLNDLVHERGEGVVGVVGASIHTDA